MPDFALLPGRKERLRSSGRREDLVDILHRADGVKLVEIHMIGVETLQGALQLLACTLGVATHSLFRQEDLAAIWPQRFTEFDFRFPIEVRRGAVEVVHASVVGRRDAARGLLGRKTTNHDAAEGNDGEANSIPGKAAWQRGRRTECRSGCQSRSCTKKLATIHKSSLAHCSARKSGALQRGGGARATGGRRRLPAPPITDGGSPRR